MIKGTCLNLETIFVTTCLYLFMSRCAFVYVSVGCCLCPWSSDFRFGFDDSQTSLLWFGARLPEALVWFPALFCRHTVPQPKDSI